MQKRMAGLLIVGILLLWNTTDAAASGNKRLLFRDVAESDWFYPHLEELQEHNIFSGFKDNTFRPETHITVGDFAALVKKSIKRANEINLTDVENSVRNDPEDHSDSSRPLTRYEAAKMMAPVTSRYTDEKYQRIIPLISDYDVIPETYQPSVLEAYHRGLLSGYPDGAFMGDALVTRAEAAVMASKLVHGDLRSDLDERVSAFEASIQKDTKRRAQLIETALTLQGVPYRWGGTSPSGLDSSGFIWYVFQENGIDIPRVSFDIYRFGKPISPDDLKPGDLVFFEGYKPGPSHGSIYIGDGQFIHSPSTGKTITIDSLSDPAYWGPKRYGAIRIL